MLSIKLPGLRSFYEITKRIYKMYQFDLNSHIVALKIIPGYEGAPNK